MAVDGRMVAVGREVVDKPFDVSNGVGGVLGGLAG